MRLAEDFVWDQPMSLGEAKRIVQAAAMLRFGLAADLGARVAQAAKDDLWKRPAHEVARYLEAVLDDAVSDMLKSDVVEAQEVVF